MQQLCVLPSHLPIGLGTLTNSSFVLSRSLAAAAGSSSAICKHVESFRREARLGEHISSRRTDGNQLPVLVHAAKQHNEDDIGSTVRSLQSINRFPKKWLGQHYMVNENVNQQVVDAAEIQPGDIVLEIGPGTGSLTKVLVEAGAFVIAVEKDLDMASLISRRFQGNSKVRVVPGDFLKWPVRSEMHKLLQEQCLTSEQSKLAKDEAALRLANCAPCPDDYRPITIAVNFFSVPKYAGKVPRKAFFPEPRVDGGVISFELKKESEYPPVGPPNVFFSMINSAFNGKRKMLRNSLQHMFSSPSVQAALLSGGLPATARPEELTLEEFVAFYNTVSSMPSMSKAPADNFVSL